MIVRNKTQSASDWTYVTISLLFIFLSVIVLVKKLRDNFGHVYFDDAFMFVRYAIHFVEGYGIAWNPDGHQTYGVTSLLYFFLITIVYWISLCGRTISPEQPPVDDNLLLNLTSTTIGLLFLVLLVVTAVRMCAFVPFRRCWLGVVAFVVSTVVVAPHFSFHLATGMETTLACLLHTALIALVWRLREHKGSLLPCGIGFVGYLCFLCRPDSFIYAVLFPVLGFLFLFQVKRWKQLGCFAISLGVFLLLDLAWKMYVFGDPLPLPFYAKQAGYYEGFLGYNNWSPVGYSRQMLFISLPFLLLLFCFSTVKSFRLVVVFLLPVVMTYSYYFSVTQIMGFYARFYYPALPFIVLCSIAVVNEYFMSHALDEKLSAIPARIFSLLIFYLLFLTPYAKDGWTRVQDSLYPQVEVVEAHPYEVSASVPLPEKSWNTSTQGVYSIVSHLDSHTVLAMSEYGVIGARVSDMFIVDLVGLHDPYYARHGFDPDRFFDDAPDFIWMPTKEYSKLNAMLVTHPIFQEDYDYYPEAFSFGVALKRSSPYYQQMQKVLQEVWRLYYPNYSIKNYEAHFSLRTRGSVRLGR